MADFMITVHPFFVKDAKNHGEATRIFLEKVLKEDILIDRVIKIFAVEGKENG